MDRPGNLVQWNISKILTACCQITYAIPWLPCEQLPYPHERPWNSQMWRRDKSDLPLSVLSYKYSLLRYSFSTLSFYSPKSTFFGGGITRGLQELQQRPFFTNPQVFVFFPARRWPSTSLFLRSAFHPFSCTFTVLLFVRNLSYWIFLFLFVLLFTLKNF